MTESPIELLVVDDDEGHSELIRRNLQRIGISSPITFLTRGQDALDFVFERGAHRAMPAGRRLLVLLDINMPGSVNGIEVLRQIKADPAKRRIPVIMLTTTDDPRDVNRCYDLGASLYIMKPVETGRFVEAVKRLGLFLAVASLPTEAGGAP